MADTSNVTFSFELSFSSDPASVWRVVADTEWLNHRIGHPSLAVEAISDASAVRARLRARIRLHDLELDEEPHQWRENEWYSAFRTARSGPFVSVKNVVSLVALPGGGTRLRYEVTYTPRHALGRLAILTFGRLEVATTRRALAGIDGGMKGGPLTRIPTGAFQRAAAALRERAGAENLEAAEKLLDLVRTGEDPVVHRMRPRALASEWGLPPEGVVEVFLHAVLAGVLELSWDLVCPSCRTGAKTIDELSELPEQGHCHFCDLVFGVDLDRAVEAVFRPHSSLREVPRGPWCVGGPGRTPHVVAQVVVEPDSSSELQAPEKEGRYRLFGRGGAVAQVELVSSAPDQAEVLFEGDRLEPRILKVRPSALIRVLHQGELQRHIKLEHVTWADHALSAQELGFHPLFRRYFSRQLLRARQALTVSRMAVMFTDLTGSTELYARVGDAGAFQFVHDHFEFVSELVQRHRGTVIKTIGDAVMVGFSDEAEALRAAIELQRRWGAFVSGFPFASGTSLKIGLYGGPCYAVTANERLDLFGQSVNVAARLQATAGPGEIIAEAKVLERLDPSELDAIQASARYVPDLKGVEHPPEVVRIGESPEWADRQRSA